MLVPTKTQKTTLTINRRKREVSGPGNVLGFMEVQRMNEDGINSLRRMNEVILPKQLQPNSPTPRQHRCHLRPPLRPRHPSSHRHPPQKKLTNNEKLPAPLSLYSLSLSLSSSLSFSFSFSKACPSVSSSRAATTHKNATDSSASNPNFHNQSLCRDEVIYWKHVPFHPRPRQTQFDPS